MNLYSEDQRNKYSDGVETSQRKIFINEFKRLGCDVYRLGKFLEIKLNGKKIYLLETETSFTSLVAFRILKNKTAARELFQELGINYAKGYTFSSSEKKQAFEKLNEIGVAVIKPANGRKGAGVSVYVTQDIFDDAWKSAASYSDEIIVETCFMDGIEARYFVVGCKCVAVQSRLPPIIVGNGSDTIEELVRKKNTLRVESNPTRKNAPIILDSHRLNLLKQKGLTPETIPTSGEQILIDWKAGISTGGDAENITDFAHPSMKRVAEKIAQAMPGMDVIGVDILAKDHRNVATEDNYIVIEANTRPGTRGHVFPDFGEPINVCRLIAENCVKRLKENIFSEKKIPDTSENILKKVAGIVYDSWSYNEFSYYHSCLDFYDGVMFIDSNNIDFYTDDSDQIIAANYNGFYLRNLGAVYPFDQSENTLKLISYLESCGCSIATYPHTTSSVSKYSLRNVSLAWRLFMIDGEIIGTYEKKRRKNGVFRAQKISDKYQEKLKAAIAKMNFSTPTKGAYALDIIESSPETFNVANVTCRPRLKGFEKVTGNFLPLLIHDRVSKKSKPSVIHSYENYCITFLGDTNPGETYQERNAEKGKENILISRGYDNGFSRFLPLLKNSDYNIMNLEACLTTKRDSKLKDVKPYLDWTDTQKTPALLNKLSIHAVCLANNHTYDFGEEGLADSIETLQTNKTAFFGAGRNEQQASEPLHLNFELGNKHYHVIIVAGFEYRKNHENWGYYAKKDKAGINNWANKIATAQIANLKNSYPDAVIIAFPHWGSNYSYKSDRQERLAKNIIDSGASIIIGHGSHMMQEIEQYNSRTILYGIGNFVFNSPGRYRKFNTTPVGLITQLKFFIYQNKLKAYLDLYPIWTDNIETDYNTDFINKERLLKFMYKFIPHKDPDNWLIRNIFFHRDQFGYFFRMYPKL